MNTKNGKRGVVAALTAALLVTAALMTSCPAEVVTVYRDYQPPAGQGYLTITAPGFTGQRTVLPSASTWVQYDVSIQRYTALGSTGTATGAAITKANATLGDRIDLAPGFYEVTVTAYTANTPTGKAAEGTSDRFTITAGQGTAVEVVLKPLPYAATGDGSGNGTFAYTITVDEGITVSAFSITITAQGTTGASAAAATTTTAGDNVSLKPDSYLVLLTATVAAETASIVEVVNIHQNLTSSVIFKFDGKQLSAYIDGITTTYDPINVKPILEHASTAITDTTEIPLSLAATGTATITITNRSAYTSVSWYCGSLTGTPVAGTNFTITAGTAPFTQQKGYPVTVVGVADGRSYSQAFMVVIGN
jgi:hypothetical protein